MIVIKLILITILVITILIVGTIILIVGTIILGFIILAVMLWWGDWVCPECRSFRTKQVGEDEYDGVIYIRCKKCKHVYQRRSM